MPLNPSYNHTKKLKSGLSQENEFIACESKTLVKIMKSKKFTKFFHSNF